MKIKWTERITDEEVLRAGEKRNIMNTLRRRISRFIGHIVRHSILLTSALEGETSGKNRREISRMEYIGQITKDVETQSYVGIKTLAEIRLDWITT
jgi:GMP synthase PP-ATPase subunit